MENNELLNYQGYYGTALPNSVDNIWIGRVLDIGETVIYQSKTKDGIQKAFEHAVDKYIYDGIIVK